MKRPASLPKRWKYVGGAVVLAGTVTGVTLASANNSSNLLPGPIELNDRATVQPFDRSDDRRSGATDSLDSPRSVDTASSLDSPFDRSSLDSPTPTAGGRFSLASVSVDSPEPRRVAPSSRPAPAATVAPAPSWSLDSSVDSLDTPPPALAPAPPPPPPAAPAPPPPPAQSYDSWSVDSHSFDSLDS